MAEKSGVEGGDKAPKTTGRGLEHAGESAGQHAGHSARNAPRNAKRLGKGAQKGTGAGMQGAGKGLNVAGKAGQGAGKGLQGLGKGASAIPYVGTALGAGLNGAGKGLNTAGKGTSKAGKGLNKAGKKFRKAGSGGKKPNKLVKIGAFLTANVWWLILLLIVGLIAGIGLTYAVSVTNDDDVCGTGGGDSGETITGNMTGNDTGAWTKKGTPEYREGEAVFQGCKKYGMDDIHAAAATGNAGHESMYFTGGLRRHELAPSEGDDGSGQGLFQFTDQGSKYGWSPEEQVRSIMANSSYDPSGKHWMKSTGSLSELTNSFETTFERGDLDAPSRDSIAHKCYNLYAGKSDGSSDADSTADSGDSSSGSDSSCGGDMGGDTADGTGSVSEKVWSCWKPNELPADVKKYAHDPTKLGMKYGSTKGWSDPGSYPGQCVNFANSYFHDIWHLKQPFAFGMGGDMADAWNKMIDGKESKTPHAGAIVGTHDGPLTGGGGPGHTFIVQHVFSNGNFLIAEENMTWNGKGYSGTYLHGYNSMESTWNYQLLPKNLPSTSYFLPNSSKYHLNWGK